MTDPSSWSGLDPLLDQAAELLCETGDDWTVRRANARWGKTLGYAPEQLTGGSLTTLLHPDDRGALQRAERSVAATGRAPEFTARLLAADGTYQAFEWRVRAGGSGRLLALRLRWEIDRIEERMRETHHSLRTLLERGLDAFFIKDLDGRYTFINPRGAEYVGRTVDDILGRTDAELWAPDEAAETRARDLEILETGEPAIFRPTAADLQRERAFLSAKYPFHDRFGKLAGVMGVSHDVTEWLAAQEQARLADAAFRRLVEASPELVLVHRQGRIAYANPAARRALELPEPEGTALRDRLAPGDRDALGELSDAEPRTLGLLRPDGRVVRAEVVAIEVPWGGEPATVLLGRDVTERRSLELRLAQADRLASVGTLAAGVAHEINNPLTYVLAHLRYVEKRLDDPSLGDLLRQAADGAEKIGTIVRDLTLYARGAPTEEVRAIAIHEVLDSAAQLAGNQLRHRARLVKDYGPPATVLAQPGRLAQVFVNLLVNAAQAIPTGDAARHRVELATRNEPERVVVCVRDTGEGIPPELIDRIFEPFLTTKGIGEGTGLGLWICHGIVGRLGGTIEVQSTPGEGTEFTVALPRAASARRPRPPASSTRRRLPEGLRLLVVDDEEPIGRLVASGLAGEAEVVAVTSGRQALELLEADDAFDVVLSDLMMPDVGGIELHAALAERRPELAERMLFITGGVFGHAEAEWLEEVAEHRLAKPFTLDQLREAIGRVAVAPRRPDPPDPPEAP